MGVDGDAAAVVDDPTAAVGEEHDVDPGALPCHCLVNRVVHDLVDKMVQTGGAGRSDVHARPFTDRFEALQNRNVLSGVRHARVPLSFDRTWGEIGAGPGGTRPQFSAKAQVRAPKPSALSVPDEYANWCRYGPTRMRTEPTIPVPITASARSMISRS